MAWEGVRPGFDEAARSLDQVWRFMALAESAMMDLVERDMKVGMI